MAPLTKRYEVMRVYEKYGVLEDLRESLNFRQKKLKQIKHYVLQIEDGSDKDAYNDNVKK